MEKTAEEMKIRQHQLEGIRANHDMSLTQSAELDSILNWGVKGWNEYLVKKFQRRVVVRREARHRGTRK